MVTAVEPFREVIDGHLRLHLHPGQTKADDSKARFVAMLAGTQGGKALAITTPIPTPTGFKLMGEIEVGDVVFDEKGQPCCVIFVTPVMMGRDCYQVGFDDGNFLIADGEHRWLTQTSKQRKGEARQVETPTRQERPQCQKAERYSVVTTDEIRQTLKDYRGASNHSINLTQAIKYPKQVLPIPPYTLGAWLGDGLSRGARIFSADYEVIENIQNEGVLVGAGCKQNEGNQSLVYCVGRETRGGNDRTNPVLSNLREMGLINNKHIPEIYLISSVEQRLALLFGLMDTDGYCAEDGGSEFTTVEPFLAEGVMCLLASLGIKARSKPKKISCNGKDCGIAYRISFTTDTLVFSLARKQRQRKTVRKDVKRLFVRSIEPVPSNPVKCIAVDSPNHLYLAGRSYVPTHNTCYGVHWLYDEIQRQGEGDYLAITATFPLLKLKMLPEFLYVFDTLLHLGVWKESDKVYMFHDGKTRVIFGSATNPESIESATAKAAWLDEAGQKQFRREAWEAIQRRLSINQGRVLFTTTLYGFGWFKQEIFDRERAGDKNYDIIQFASVENPAFPREEYERARETLPRWKFDLFYDAKFSRPVGLIYDAFDDLACRINRFPVSKEWPVFVGHDFGGANPAAMFYAQDVGTGYFYAFSEYLPGAGYSTAQHVERFKEMTSGYNVIKRAGGSHQEEEIREAYRAHGWPILEPKIRDVETQIDRVYGLHKLNKIFVFNDLSNYLDEKMSYSRKLNDHYQPTDEIEDKSSYHLMDAERYILSDFTPETVKHRTPITRRSLRF